MVESSYIDEITDTNLRYLSIKNAKNATIYFRPYQEQIKSLVSFILLCVTYWKKYIHFILIKPDDYLHYSERTIEHS